MGSLGDMLRGDLDVFFEWKSGENEPNVSHRFVLFTVLERKCVPLEFGLGIGQKERMGKIILEGRYNMLKTNIPLSYLFCVHLGFWTLYKRWSKV